MRLKLCSHNPILVGGVSVLLALISTRALSGLYPPIDKPAGELPAGSSPELNHENLSNTVDQDIIKTPVKAVISTPKKIGSAKSRVIPNAKVAAAAPPQKEQKPETKPLVPVSATSLTESISKPVDAEATVKKADSDEQSDSKIDKSAAASEKAPGKSETADTALVRIEDVVETNEPYKFAGRDKFDPFAPPLGAVEVTKVAKTVEADEIPIVSPLQYHALKALAVTGVWQAEDNRWKAMVETPDKEGIVTQIGDPIGNSGGHIVNIGQNGIKVREYTLQKDGSRLYKDSVVAMAPETTIDHDTVGGKVILKPGIETPEVQRAEPHIDLTEDGFPVDGTSTSATPKKNIKNAEIAIGPNADYVLKELVRRATEKYRQEPGLLPPDLSPRSQPAPTPTPSPSPTPVNSDLQAIIEQLKLNRNVLPGGTL